MLKSTQSITLVYPFRDRPVERLINSVSSVRRYSKDHTIKCIVVDYGSSPSYRDELSKACELADIKVIRTETQGRPWNRSIASNIGISAVETDVFISMDIDIIVEFDLVSEVLSSLQPRQKVNGKPYWLPPSGNKDEARVDDGSGLGGCMAMFLSDFKALGGFNEEITFWGLEDTEFDLRAQKTGFITRWLPETLKMYHVWHPVSHGLCATRPYPSMYKDQVMLIQALMRTTPPKVEMGSILKLLDRPILEWMNQQKPAQFKTFSGKVTNELIEQMITSLERGEPVLLRTGRRNGFSNCGRDFMGRFFAKVLSLLNKLIKPLKVELRLSLNESHDWVYLLIYEFEPLIADYFWDYDEGCYFYPKNSLSANH